MLTRILPAVLALTLVTLPLSRTFAGESPKKIEPIAVASIAGSDELLGDVLYLTEASGSGDVGRLIALMASPYTAALDKTKPAGVYVVMTGEEEPGAVGFIPVKDLDMLLAALRDQIGEPDDLGDGVLEIGTGRPQSVYVKQKKAWAFITNKRVLLDDLPKNPVKLLGGLQKQYTVALRANVSNIPDDLRQMAIRELRKGFQERLEEEVDDEKAAEIARKIGERWVEEFVRLVEETEQVTLGWEVDADAQKTYLDVSVTAVEGTKLAKEMATVKDEKSAFAGFFQPGAAATFHAAGRSADTDEEMMLLLLEVLRDEMMNGINEDDNLVNDEERETAKDIVGRFLKIAEQTVKARTVNLGGTLVLKPDSLAAAVGGFVADGESLEAAIGDLWKFAKKKDPDTLDVTVETQTHQGVKLHTTKIPLDDQKAKAREVLGDPLEVVLGIGKQAVYLSFGKDSTDLLKQVIDKSLEDTETKFAPAELNIALTPILEFASSIEDDPGVQAALALLKEADGKDRISLKVMPIRRGVSVRLEIEEGVLSAAGEAAKVLRPLMAGR
jgi:hypothetical protein